jgi:hypothetical protein
MCDQPEVLFKHFLVSSNKNHDYVCHDTNFPIEIIYFCLLIYSMTDLGRYISVSIATRYELDGQGIESRWGQDFPHSSRPTVGPTQPLMEWVPGLSRG